MSSPGRPESFLLVSLAMRSTNMTLNEIIILVYAYLAERPVNTDAIQAATGLPRSTVGNVLARLTKSGKLHYSRPDGYDFEPVHATMCGRFLEELEEIGWDRQHYFSAEVLEWLTQDMRMTLDEDIMRTLLNRRLSNGWTNSAGRGERSD